MFLQHAGPNYNQNAKIISHRHLNTAHNATLDLLVFRLLFKINKWLKVTNWVNKYEKKNKTKNLLKLPSAVQHSCERPEHNN